jgi:ubiquinone/menaquinone biosynthesis C-methylase UbiE
MEGVSASAFDPIAQKYDAVWTNTPIGISQRSAVWTRIDRLFQPGDSVLDIGCGTGADALHLQSLGMNVYAIDGSANMIRIAQENGVNAHRLSIQDLDHLPMCFDGALSNFGALNCVPSLEPVAAALARFVRRGGYLALCFLNPFCAWETGHYLVKADFHRAFRRLRRRVRSSLGVDIHYFSRRSILSAFQENFRFHCCCGIGLFVPPSYMSRLGVNAIRRLAAIDKRCAHWPMLRRLPDHCLYVFERI